MDGLYAYDISNPASPLLLGYFDTYWQNTSGTYPSPGYAGAWGAYPYLPSGNILVNDMQNGLFVLDPSGLSSIQEIKPEGKITVHPDPVIRNSELKIVIPGKAVAGEMFVFDTNGRIHYKQLVNKIARGKLHSIELQRFCLYSLLIHNNYIPYHL